MRILWILALVLCASLSVAKGAAAAALAPINCPNVLLIESSNAKYYIAVFDAKAPQTTSIALTLYAKSAVYQVSLGNVDIRKPLANSTFAFRSAPVVIKNPGDEEFLGAAFHPSGAAGSSCDDANVIIPSVASLTAPDRHIDPAADAIESQLVTEAGSTTEIQTPTPAASIPVPSCPTPFADADVDELVKPDFSNDVRSDTSLSSIAIRVQISATGKMLSADVIESSGKPAVDAIALSAAKASTYHPAYFACQAEASSHVIRIDFSH